MKPKFRFIGKLVQMKCPKCEVWCTIDEDQLNGKVSILCNTPGIIGTDKEGIVCRYHAFIKSELNEV